MKTNIEYLVRILQLYENLYGRRVYFQIYEKQTVVYYKPNKNDVVFSKFLINNSATSDILDK